MGNNKIMVLGHQKTESRRRMLREIADAGPIPRIDLAERTGISRATVTTITADLLRGGLIQEVPRNTEEDARRGRPRVDLRLFGDAHLVAGVRVADTALSYVLMDFEGQELAQIDLALPQGRHAPEALARQIAEGLRELAETASRSMQHITGVGVALPGLIDAESGTVYWSPVLDRRNCDFGAILSQQTNRPAFIDNDANLVAIAELRFGKGRAHKDFIVVTIENGVGMGIVLEGALYRGTRGSGGEFGHTKVQLDGALCRCEQRGCLEAYVADYALQREAVSVGLIPPGMPAQDAVQTVLTAARNGEDLAQDVVSRAGRMFALGLANLANIFDPELIILAGEQMQAEYLYADVVIEDMRKSIIQIDRPAPRVVVHKWDNAMWARGAAAHALDFVHDIAVQELEDAH